jgi:hypothetical protein
MANYTETKWELQNRLKQLLKMAYYEKHGISDRNESKEYYLEKLRVLLKSSH